ncbi:peptidylprolyl isomerase [Mastigocoleus sp. MO_188.B34]|uniref:peptidylprolyl isomerase n=1 Tax=Mastigocoleus sp. MO_188.B34 TaxID=3036635 RepID=UPI00262F1C99|nr:peptidylprolyl isomerase [Mastigocoleus sp. MO_188.B34]MDJ0695502.1 peptidylprolyl isomerase [Mastigocoleus sp. MO_188.B34]
MSEILTLSPQELFNQVRISCQIPATVERFLHREIVTRTAKEADIKIEPNELQEAADTWRLMNQLHSVDDTWSWLHRNHISLDEFEELISANILSSKLAQHLFAHQIEPYFLEFQQDYARVAMYEIVLDDVDIARELFYALSEEEISFFEAAYQYITDTELRRKGGYKGVIYRKDLKPKISAAVFAANPPQILKLIITAEGVHLIRVEEVIEPKLDETLRQSILTDLFSNWLKQQVGKFEVEINCDSSSSNHNQAPVSTSKPLVSA